MESVHDIEEYSKLLYSDELVLEALNQQYNFIKKYQTLNKNYGTMPV